MGIIEGLYIPDLSPDQIDLNQSIQEVEDPRVVSAKTDRLISNPDPSHPLTEEEAALVDTRIAEQRVRIAATLQKIKVMHERLDKDGSEVEFSFDIKARGSLKRAIHKVFGMKSDKITYNMYVEALQAKHLLELTDTQEYLDGDSTEKKTKRRTDS